MIYDKELRIEGEVFDGFREKLNTQLWALLRRMDMKGTHSGKLTATLEIELRNDEVGGRVAKVPTFDYKVGHQITLKDEEKDSELFAEDELICDHGVYVLRPITGADQQSIYDRMDPETGEIR